MGSWSFLSDHRRVLLFLTRTPGIELDDIAAHLGVTERSAHAIVADLTAAGYVSYCNDRHRDRYQIVAHEPLPEPMSREKTFREVLALFSGTGFPPAQGEQR
jgi:predicted transcriptional regulator